MIMCNARRCAMWVASQTLPSREAQAEMWSLPWILNFSLVCAEKL